jgi:O-antigen ligase
MTDEDFEKLQVVGGINVHNDFLQFLAEHGLIGFLLLVFMIVLLLKPIFQKWKLLVVSAAFTKKSKRPPRPIAIFALPASAFCLLLAMCSTLLHSMADCPLRSPAVLSLFFVMIAAIEGFMPRISDNED